jgi:ribonucleoside-diphosphate reductase alpha chain
MFLDDTACNLASMNLLTFYKDGTFDAESYMHATRLWTLTLEISVMMAQFPSKEIAQLLRLPHAGPGLRQYRRAADEHGLRLRQRRGPRHVRRADRDHDRRGLCDLGRDGGPSLAPFSGYRAQPRAHAAGDAQPPQRRLRRHRRLRGGQREAGRRSTTPTAPTSGWWTWPSSPWDEALTLGEAHGYRNAQATVIAPTGTIGLVMDCDTTGIEPDFALVKFKKLAGGGYFKIINRSVPAALETLGYTPAQIEEIVAYAVGHGTLGNAPGINHTALIGHGFGPARSRRSRRRCRRPSTSASSSTSGPWARSSAPRLGHPGGKAERSDLRHARHLGFSKAEIEAANDHVCGTMTLEGAPHLKDEHLRVFDCANPCGKKGKRFLSRSTATSHDGRGAVLHLGRDLQDDQHAQRRHHRGLPEGLRAVLVARHQGQRALPRRLQAQPAARRRAGRG